MWSAATTSDLVSHVARYVIWALEHKEVQASQVTMEWLDKAKDGTPGAVPRVLAKLMLVLHCDSLVAELPKDSKTKQNLLTVLESFASYRDYDIAFNNGAAKADASTLGEDSAPADAPTLDENATAAEQQDQQQDPFEKMREKCARHQQRCSICSLTSL